MYSEEEIKRAQRIWMRIIIPTLIVSTPGLVYYFLNQESLFGYIGAFIYGSIGCDIFLSLFDPRFKDKKYREKLVSILIAMALVAAVRLSNRYITDRFLPDKAIDLIDEAAARVRIEIASKPDKLDEVDRRLMQLKIEQQALRKEKDEDSKKRLAELDGIIRETEEESKKLTAQWRAEQDKMRALSDAMAALDAAKAEGPRCNMEKFQNWNSKSAK